MTRTFTLLFAVLALLAPPVAAQNDGDLDFLIRYGQKEPKARTPGAIRLATYNVENLFDDVDDPALSGQQEDATMTVAAERLEALARAIHRIDADIIALQEIENEHALAEFRDHYLSDMGYAHLASIDAGDERGIEQAVLSRYPITHVENWVRRPLGGVHPDKYGDSENWHAGEPIVFHRSPLRVDVMVAGVYDGPPDQAPTITLVVVHHKSGRPAGYWREAEARGAVEILSDLEKSLPNRPIFVLGDFNEVSAGPPLETYRDAGFIDAFDDAPQADPRSISHASGRRIDHILMNPAAADLAIRQSRFVLGTIGRMDGQDWRSEPPPGYASDHYPVVIDLHRPTGASPHESSR
ncbi:MAG: endonuclease/exonuclease/phosphatase family protein [Phycisphaeraceae bacterium]|nr:endonuclease/exonuclease/phosphatase family protein [Phycisphaeraceae bacterium]